MTEDMTYTTVEVCKMTGATYRQLDYWARTARVPGQPDGSSVGSGNRRRWTHEQVERVELLLRASELVNNNLDRAIELLRTRERA